MDSLTGVDSEEVFVDYDSKAHYDAVLQSEKKRIWNPKWNTPEFMVKAGEKEDYTGSDLTDDGKYVGRTIYTRDYEGAVEFSVYVWED